MMRQNVIKLAAIAVAVLAFVAGAAMLLVVPAATSVMNGLAGHLRTALAVVTVVSALGGAGLFVAGVKVFRAKLGVAYIILAAGISMFGFALVQLPIAGFFNLWKEWWFHSGMLIVPFVLATTLIYVGMRQFSRLIEVRNPLERYSFAVGLGTAFTVLSFVAGHYVVLDHAVDGTDFYTAVVGWSAIYLTFAALLARGILQRIGSSYQNATRWLFVAMVVLSAGAWHEYVINFFMNTDTWYVATGLSLIPFVAGGFTLVRAGYAFCSLSVQAAPYILAPEVPPTATDDDYINSIITLAALASRQHDIDPILDTLRAVTAAVVPNHPLSPAAKQKLIATYHGVEAYLMHQDPLRLYPREELRKRLKPAFRRLLEPARA